MIFGKTYKEQQADNKRRAAARIARGKFLLFPRCLDSGRWAWLERVAYTEYWQSSWDGGWLERTYYDPNVEASDA